MFGLEDLLAEELSSLGAENILKGKRSVSFEGDHRTIYNANIKSRFSIRILRELLKFNLNDEKELYSQIRDYRWEDIFSKRFTFAVDSTVNSPNFNHANFVALKAKDAIVDRLRQKWGFRPDINPQNPDLLIHVHINIDECHVSIDSSGDSLHKRGWRIAQNDAPLNEILAAAMIKLSGWDPSVPFIDGMCGSGTLLLEAASIAKNYPPALKRYFAFEKWIDYDKKIYEDIIADANKNIIPQPDVEINGIDISLKSVNISRSNLKEAGFDNIVTVRKNDFLKYKPESDKGILILNPPYGIRINSEEDVVPLYKEIGNKIKFDYTGFTAWVLSGNLPAMKFIGLKPQKKIILMNGAIECRYAKYEVFSGKLKENINLS